MSELCLEKSWKVLQPFGEYKKSYNLKTIDRSTLAEKVAENWENFLWRKTKIVLRAVKLFSEKFVARFPSAKKNIHKTIWFQLILVHAGVITITYNDISES